MKSYKRINPDDPVLKIIAKGYQKVKSLDKIVVYLDKLGYVSGSGQRLTISHVSNFYRRHFNLRRVKKYQKPNYKGRNWMNHSKSKKITTSLTA